MAAPIPRPQLTDENAPELPDDDWMSNPAPVPRSLDPALAPAGIRKAPARPKGNVTPLRPLDQLGEALDDAPLAPATPGKGRGRGGAAPPPPPPETPPPEALPPAEPGGGPSHDRPRGEIWRGCPVRPLGVNAGIYYYLDVLSQLQGVQKLEAQQILKLFGNRIPALCYHFAQWNAPKDGQPPTRKPHRFDQTTAAMMMYAAASEKGLFSPDGAVRGVGAWVDDDGNLVYHTGDALLIGDQERTPDAHLGKIYPAYPSIPRPHPAGAEKVTDPAPAILEAFGTWAWTRPEVDAMFALGMVGCQMMGGALSWRPTFWNTGSRATGKSSFQNLLKHLHGLGGLIQSTDATKSGITSRIGHSSLPVALDELEPGEDGNGKEKAIIDLARVASSGGEWMRGSADQKGASGNVYSTFFFSSIIIPGSMGAADRSRLVVLSLEPLPEGATPPVMRPETWRKRGAILKRQLIDRWAGWEQRLALWREALAAHKLGASRDLDNYSTIMAMAHMALSAEMPTPDELTGWAAKVARNVRASVDEIGSDADDVLTHLLSQTFDPFRRGERYTIATWLKAAGQRPRAGARLFAQATDEHTQGLADSTALAEYAKRANATLATIGLRVVGTAEAPVLFVANAQMQGLKDIFQRSAWAQGAWTQSLKRVKGAVANAGPRRIDGLQTKGTEVPFSAMPGLMFFDTDEVAAAPPAPPISMEDTY